MPDAPEIETPVNDNMPIAPAPTISFTDLAAGLGAGEDFLLRRLTKILNKRNAAMTEVTPDKLP